MNLQNHGFNAIQAAQDIKTEDYIFGGKTLIPATTDEILQATGDWSDYLPEPELQARNGVETYACVSYGILNAIEILLKRKFSFEANYSERFTAIVSETGETGNSPNKVAEAIRKIGVIEDSLLPFHEMIRTNFEYYQPQPMNTEFLYAAKKWLDKWSFKHEWVFTPFNTEDKKQKMKEALKFSPLGVSVMAWKQDANGFYTKEYGEEDNHWVTIYGYKDKEFWRIFDHYNNTMKELIWDYDFGFCKRYWLDKAIPRTFWNKFGVWWKKIIAI